MEDQKQHLLHTETANEHLQPLGVEDALPRSRINRRLGDRLSYLCASILLNIILATTSLALIRANAAPPAPLPHSTNCKSSKASNASQQAKYPQPPQLQSSGTKCIANTRQITTNTASSLVHHPVRTSVHGPHWLSVEAPTHSRFQGLS